MDGARVGDYFTLKFNEAKRFNGFRFECGGGGDTRGIQQNVFEIQYWEKTQSTWVTVGTTNTADGICGPQDSSGYAQWGGSVTSTEWRFILTEQHGGPWYHGFAWYGGSGADDTGRGKL